MCGKLPKTQPAVTHKTAKHFDLTPTERLALADSSERKNSFSLQPAFSTLMALARIAAYFKCKSG
jgi:hypothetical protein